VAVVPTTTVVIRIETRLNATALGSVVIAAIYSTLPRSRINVLTAEFFTALPTPAATASSANYKSISL
jgi:hypothetical protein